MNKNLIYQAIQNPEALVNLATDDLERLTKEHPWFSAAHVLLAKKYQMNADYRFTDQLHTAAMLSGNRTSLYRYLSQKEEATPELPLSAPLDVVKEPISQEAKAEEANELDDLFEQQEAFFDIFTEQTPPTEQAIDSVVQQEEQSPAGDLISVGTLAERILAEESKEYKPEVEEKFGQPEQDLFPEQLITTLEEKKVQEKNTLTPETEAPVSDDNRGRKDQKTFDALDREILVNALHKSIEIEVSEPELDEEEIQEEDSDHRLKKLDDEGLFSSSDPYTAWLMRRAREIRFTNVENQSSPLPEQKDSHQSVEAHKPHEGESTHGISHGVDRLQAPDKTRHQRDLIDRFIQQEPKISQGKASDYTGVNFGKESLEDSLGLVTETMAKLYASQGKIDKARKAYKRLIELHPEKSVYFAAQLKNLNTKK